MDNSVNKLGDKLMDKSVHNPVEKPQRWFEHLALQLIQLHTDGDVDKNSDIYQLIINIGTALQAGHTCYLLPVEMAAIEHPLIVDEKDAYEQPAPLVRAGDYVYFYRQWQQEYALAAQIMCLTQCVSVSNIQEELLGTLNAAQQQAVKLASQSSFSLITGGPGTGKTYTLVHIVQSLQQAQPELRIALAAPTGKAAQRMQSVLMDEFTKKDIDMGFIHPAQTVHRLLGLGGTGQPRYHRHHPLPYDLIVLDEGSMLDLELASQLFAAIRVGTRVIVLGDADQLAAVEAGAVLSDLQAAQALAPFQVHLTESKRFNATRGIGSLASATLQQKPRTFWHALAQDQAKLDAQVAYYPLVKEQPPAQVYAALWQGYTAYVDELHRQSTLPSYELDTLFKVFDCYRVLAAMRGSELGVEKINQALSSRLRAAVQKPLSSGEWFQGRPVMVSRNDYGLQLSNGDIGICLKDPQQHWQVYFPHLAKPIAVTRLPQQDISTAFALTIHKSQGSEFEHVAVVLTDKAQQLLSRELLYTAMTRARNQLSIWGSERSINHAIMNKTTRDTGLSRHMRHIVPQDEQFGRHPHQVTVDTIPDMQPE